jgi:hypothetical protein
MKLDHAEGGAFAAVEQVHHRKTLIFPGKELLKVE